MARALRIATRASALAQWQARHVAALIGGDTELVLTQTSGDADQRSPISEIGGKGVFAKEVQYAVLDGRADIAVHSAKDLPSITTPGLVLAAAPDRGDPRDALVGARLADLAEGAVVATGSHRRRVQLQALRPDLRFAELRGNIATRLDKAAGFDAIVTAAAALDRLELSPAVVDLLDVATMVPQVGQGTLAVECRDSDHETMEGLAAIESPTSRRRLDAERAFLVELGGDCELPAGAHATIDGDDLVLRGILGSTDGNQLVSDHHRGPDGPALGAALARSLRDRLDETRG